MTRFQPWQSGAALLTALSLSISGVAPVISALPASAQATQNQASFVDVPSSYWAKPFIQELANIGVISGFPDGTFRPDEPVTRAQFAAIVRQAFRRGAVRAPIRFADVPSSYWATGAIQDAYATGFMSGYPGNEFRPEQQIPRVQVLTALTSGLQYSPAGSNETALQIYSDAAAIPDWARSSVAAATQKQLVVNYPNPQFLSPDRPATRADVAAFIYQALVSTGNVAAIPSQFIVGQASMPSTPSTTTGQLPAGTTIPTRYDEARRILLSLKEPKPVPVTLTIARNITAPNGQVLIPANSQVVGELQVVDERGAQFHAQELVLADQIRIPMDATSPVVTNTRVINRGANVLEILSGAVLGSGAAAGIAAVTGDRKIDTVEVLGGTAFGTLSGLFLGRDQVTLVSIDPNTDLNLTLNAPLTMR